MKIILPISIIILSFFNMSCKNQSRNNESIEKIKSGYIENDLILALLTFKMTSFSSSDSILFDKYKFIKIAGMFLEHFASIEENGENIKSIENKVELNLDTIDQKIFSFIDNYKIVSNLIFSNIEDDDLLASQEFENKIMGIDKLSRVYRLYVNEGQNLSTLSSTGGVALNVHIAYFLSLLPEIERKKIIKNLL